MGFRRLFLLLVLFSFFTPLWFFFPRVSFSQDIWVTKLGGLPLTRSSLTTYLWVGFSWTFHLHFLLSSPLIPFPIY